MSSKSKLTLIGVISVLVLPFLPASAAAAAAPGDVLVARGTVSGAGQPIGGEIVSLYAWPSAQVLDGLQPGAHVPTTLLATTVTGSDGNYSLYAAPAALQAADVSGGKANLEVDAGTGSWFFAADTASPAPATANMTSMSNAVSSNAVPAAPLTCVWAYLHQLNRDWATVGSTYIWHESAGVTGDLVYTQSQSSTLGIGFSATAAFGSFSAGGTESQTSTGVVGYPIGNAGDNWEYQTQWRTALYEEICSPGGVLRYKAQANGWLGGQNIIVEAAAPATQSAYCSPYFPGAGSFFQTTTEQALTWSGSLGLGMTDIGFSATAQTGYDHNAQLT